MISPEKKLSAYGRVCVCVIVSDEQATLECGTNCVTLCVFLLKLSVKVCCGRCLLTLPHSAVVLVARRCDRSPRHRHSRQMYQLPNPVFHSRILEIIKQNDSCEACDY